MPRFAALALATVLSGCGGCQCKAGPPAAEQDREGPYEIEHIVDGDTVEVRKGTVVHRVRFLCIDTPETRGKNRSPLGDSATDALTLLIGDEDVYLQRDDTHDEADKYGRLLRHVYLWDGTHLNVEMVRLGWSAYYTKFGPCHRTHDDFVDAEEEASHALRGIWAHPDFLRGGYLENARGGPGH